MKSLTEASARLTAPADLADLLNKNVYSSVTHAEKLTLWIEKTRSQDYQVKLVLLCGHTKN